MLTIAGTGFDKDMTKVSVAFSDTTKCTVQTSSATQITCLIDGFDKTALNTATPYATTVTVNTINNADQSVNILGTKQNASGLSPTSVSPVLATVLTVTLESTYPGDMSSKDKFSAKLIKTDDNTERPLYVKAVDATAKTVDIKFAGANSGTYKIALESTDIGRIDLDSLNLAVESKVTGITPLTGSYLGGTLVTITGTNFSNDKLDNPVKAGNTWCDVQTTNPTQITCRVRATGLTAASSGKLSTFLRAQEEAVATIDNTWNFATPSATVSGLTADFDTATNTQILTLAGIGFPTDHSLIELWIDGQK